MANFAAIFPLFGVLGDHLLSVIHLCWWEIDSVRQSIEVSSSALA